MITNYLSFCSGSFYCMPFNSRRCNRPMHRLNHRSKPFCMVCTLSATQASRLQTLLFIILKIMVLSRMAREYPVRVCVQCGCLMKGQFLFLVACSVFSVFCRLLSAPLQLALAFFAAPFSHGLKALVWTLRCSIFTRCFGCPR